MVKTLNMLPRILCLFTCGIVGCAAVPAPTTPLKCPSQDVSGQARATTSFGGQVPDPSGQRAYPGDPAATPLDPTVTDGDKYHAILENDQVRVLSYRDKPGEKTHPHHHSAFVLYALSAFRRKLIFPDGTAKERDFKPGDVIWMPEQNHVGENTGTTDTDVVIVEFKPH